MSVITNYDEQCFTLYMWSSSGDEEPKGLLGRDSETIGVPGSRTFSVEFVNL